VPLAHPRPERASRPIEMRRICAATAALLLVLAGGCGTRPGSAAPRSDGGALAGPSLSPFRAVKQEAALPEGAGPDTLRAGMIADVRDRLMSHRDIEQDAARIVNEVEPIVAEAAGKAEARAALARYAADAGITVDAARRRWIALQTADLMLESGGDPDALSSSAAAGAAQWLAGTGRGAGLRVDLPVSNRLTKQITALRCRIAWIEYLARPDANRAAPGAPPYSPSDTALLPSLRAELQGLRVARQRADSRYDSRQAIIAQTRYLLRLYPKFPSPDWLFQAYHGGEAGVSRTLRLYLGAGWHGSAAEAIRHGDGGAPLTYDRLFFATSPASHAQAFSYLFGRSDDHRHYWYKLLAAEQTIDAYRKSPAAFHADWQTHLPGRRIEAYWYPDAPAEVRDANAQPDSRRELVRVAAAPGLAVRPPRDDPGQGPTGFLRPEAKGALLTVVREFQRDGGRGPLTLGDTTQTQAYLDRARLLHPGKPPPLPLFPPDPDAGLRIGGGPPRSFDYHVTGLVFDILWPADDRDRKVLEYVLDRLEAEGVLAAIPAKDQDERRYHVVPHPAYRKVFEKLSRSAN